MDKKSKNIPNRISATKVMVQFYVKTNRIDIQGYTDGDIFRLTRDIEDSVEKNENIKITNIVDVYRWLIEYRNGLRKVV